MENKISLWKEDGLALASLVLALIAFQPPNEARDAEIIAQVERAAAEKKADLRPEDYVALHHPIDCPYIEQCGAEKPCKRRYTCAADLRERK